ncbi:MAG: preprotein translocase subunit SecY [Nitrospinota bacterium]
MVGGGLQNLFKIPELKKRILFTLGLLAIYRIGAHIPTPGIDGKALGEIFARTQGTILGFFDMFSGGALSRLTIFALGIMPYISASIILQLLTIVWPYLDKLKKEGEQGQRKITQYTRYGTVLLSIIQSAGISFGLEAMRSPGGAPIVPSPGWPFRLMTILTLTAGTAFIMWLGEQITERGIGNGISLIIFAGIIVGIPSAIGGTMDLLMHNEIQLFVLLFLLLLMIAVVVAIVFTESGQRRIPIHYAKRVVGRKMYGGQSTHLPLRVNTSGVIPPIFASSIIMFPATIASFSPEWFPEWLTTIMDFIKNNLTPGTILYSLVFVGAIFFFCYFYTAIIFNPVDVADNMKKYGGYVPGIRPGSMTSGYIDKTLSRITFAGAMYLSVICILPSFLIKYLNIPFYFGGTSLLIVVGVAMDTMQQVESHLVMRHYEGFLKRGKLKGRRG